MCEINVCISCDDNYAKYAGVTIASILYNKKDDDKLVFYILDGGITKDNKEKLVSLNNIKNCTINFIKVDENLFEEYKKVRTHYYITLPAFYRLKLPSILPNIDKIIYLDCDVVVCTSLSELYNTNFGNNLIAGVKDTDKNKLKKNPTYINSGVVVFDLKKMRQHNTENEFLKWTLNNISTIKLGDQEIINEVLKGKIKIVDDKWNVQSSNFINRSSYTNHPKIIHMLAKPWKYASACIHKQEYFKYLQETPWAITQEELKHWTIDNERDSIIAYIKRRPFFWLRPNFYVALFYKYILKGK